MLSRRTVVSMLLVGLLLLLTASSAEARRRRHKYEKQKQIYDTRETNPPNFIRLVLMRLIYGIAAQMGVEERLNSFLGGVFAPPNADDDDYGFGEELADGFSLF